MKIIITKTFLKDFKEVFYDEKFLWIFFRKLKEKKLIFLTDKLYKFKFYIKTISVRWVIFINVNNVFIPILLVKKSDKNIWENLILNKSIKEIIDTKLLKMWKDLKSWDYQVFE